MAEFADLMQAAYLNNVEELGRHSRVPRFSSLGYVYVMKGIGYIKIGYSGHPEGRMNQIQNYVPFKLTLLGQLHGTDKTERALHRVIDSHRSRGDWFKYNAYTADAVTGLLGVSVQDAMLAFNRCKRARQEVATELGQISDSY